MKSGWQIEWETAMAFPACGRPLTLVEFGRMVRRLGFTVSDRG